jgi:hypothetical protein
MVETSKRDMLTIRENIFHSDNNILTFFKVCFVLIE